MSKKVSDAAIRRLPRYYRHLKEMEREGISRTSSQALSQRMGLTASQIRQDFNHFGGFGQQGYGYKVKELCDALAGILGQGQNRFTIRSLSAPATWAGPWAAMTPSARRAFESWRILIRILPLSII